MEDKFMNNPVIVIPCFNKTNALKRLLSSLLKADYPEHVKIIFSVDGGGDPDVLRCAEEFDWPYGEKEVVAHDENIGLRQNILHCGGLSEKYGSVIVLEDDSYVSRDFYHYALKAKEFYSGDDYIAGISLYAYEYSEISQGRFYPLYDGAGTYFMQWASSRGQLWTDKHWGSFSSWYGKNKETDLSDFNIPEKVAGWPEGSWKKYYIAYLVDADKFFVYPYSSFVSNCGDIGTHCGKGRLGNRSFVGTQVCLPLKYETVALKFSAFSSSAVKYDAFFEIDPKYLKRNSKLSEFEFDVDLAGAKQKKNFTKEYVLSSKKFKNPVFSFDHALIPMALNVIHDCEGRYLSLGKVDDLVERDGVSSRVYRYTVNRELPSDRKRIEFLTARILKELALASNHLPFRVAKSK